jgi:integrase
MNMARPRAKAKRRDLGQLFKRGKIFWLRYEVPSEDGKRKRVAVSLGTADEATAKQVAEDKHLRYLRVKDEATRLRMLQNDAASFEDQAQAMTDEANRCPIAEAWAKFPYKETQRKKKRRDLRDRSVRNNEQMWSDFAAWMQERHPDRLYLNDVGPEIVKEYSTYLLRTKKLTARRHNRRIAVLRVVFNLAGIMPNPWADAERAEDAPESRTFLTEDQIRTAAALATGELRTLLAIGVYSGLRLSDAVNLQWQNIQGGMIVKTARKTGKALTPFPIHPALQRVLEEIPGRKTGYLMPELAERYSKDPPAVTKAVTRLFEAAGVEVREKLAGRLKAVNRAGFHALRHTFASICARANIPLAVVQSWLGHSSEEITKIYSHVRPSEDYRRIVEIMPDNLGFGELPALSPAETTLDRLARLAKTWNEEQLLAAIEAGEATR